MPKPPSLVLIGAARLVRSHLGLVVLLCLGAALRGLFAVGYRSAFWFHGDSGTYLSLSQSALEPDDTRPLGYVVLLKALAPTGRVLSVVAVQHLLGLLLGLAVYLFLQRRGVSRWLSCLATAPVFLDTMQVTLEHYILAEILFTALLVGGVLAVLWRPVPDIAAAASSGLLLAAAWFTRPNALPVIAAVGLYLVVRRTGWRPVLAYATAFAVPFAAVMLWLAGQPSPYGGSATAVNLYARTALFADCDTLVLPAEQRAICPSQPLDRRTNRADSFIWSIGPKQVTTTRTTGEGQEVLIGFALSVISQQPGDFLRVVSRETAAHFVPGLSDLDCLMQRYRPPITTRRADGRPGGCPPTLASTDFRPGSADPRIAPRPTPLTRALHRYGAVTRSGPVMLSGAVLLASMALLMRRRVDWPSVRDSGMLAATSAAMITSTVAMLMYEPRYAAPTLPLLCVSAALAGHALFRRPQAGAVNAAGPSMPSSPGVRSPGLLGVHQ